jgi:hypothetical protein
MKKSYNERLEFLRKKRIKKKKKRLRKKIQTNKHLMRSIERNQHIKEAPKMFSFINNTNEMLSFFEIDEIKNKLKKNVKFDLRDISTLTSDAIAVYVSMFTDKNYSEGIHLLGNAPRNPTLREMFFGSGFYEHVHSKRKPQTGTHNFLLHKVSNKKVDTSVAKMATDFAAKYTFRDGRKFRPIYEIIIELMANTNNHASVLYDGFHDWWLYVFYDKVTNITSYTFLDFGVGIFKSKPFMNYFGLLVLTLKIKKSTTEMAQDLLEGRITSRTGKGERGRGFTCITRNAENNAFKKFIIITNNVYIDVKAKSSKELSSNFAGTFVYWEVCS